MSYRDSQRYRKVYSYYRPVPRPTDAAAIGTIDKAYVDALFQSLDWKQSVRYASTTNVSLLVPGSIDGSLIPLEDEDRILLKDQTDPKENGIYIFNLATNRLIRTLDGSQDSLTCGATVYVEEGNVNEGTVWTLATHDPIVVDTTHLTWVEKVGPGAIHNQWNELAGPSLNTTASVALAGALGSSYSANNAGADVFFFVSGSLTGQDKSVFGGDVFVSGVIYAPALSGSLTTLLDGTPYIIGGTNVTVTTSSNGSLTIDSYGGQTYAKGFVLGSTQNAFGDLDLSSIGSLLPGYDQEKDIDIYINGQLVTAPADYTMTSQTVVNIPSILAPTDVITAKMLVSSSTGYGSIGLTPGGINTSVQFNDGGNFGGSTAFTFNKLNSTVTTHDLQPAADVSYNLGSPSRRWNNIYTGDLHLKNDRGDWTVVEEEDYLCVINNKTGKKFKMALIPIEG